MSALSTNSAAENPRTGVRGYDVEAIRAQFPILHTRVHGKQLIYLDNGATTQKPRAVIDAIRDYYESQNANIHRGVYFLSQLATEKYEHARRKVREFINAAADHEIIFTRGTTEGINLVASSLGRSIINASDEILVSTMEHHSNIVPWQMMALERGAVVRPIPISDSGEMSIDEYRKLLGSGRVKIVAVNHLSNSLGTINDVATITKLAHEVGALVMVDGAQWVAHGVTNVREIDADFYTFSGHKLYGPTGIGVLYGKAKLLEAMPPYQGGGDMIASVKFEGTTYAELPNKFEAGTPDIAGAVGLAAAIDFLNEIGMGTIAAWENQLGHRLTERIGMIGGVRIVGTAKNKGGICSFVVENPPISSHDLGVMLDLHGIAVRTGHHCCQPAMERMNVSSTTRASVGLYNTPAEIDRLAEVLANIIAQLRPGKSPATSEETPQSSPPAASSAETVKFPAASAASPNAAADELAETFELLGDDPAAKASFLMEDLARELPKNFDLLKKLTSRLEGCMSEVYLVGRRAANDSSIVEFIADANSEIVRGEIVMLQRLFSGQKAGEVLAFDVDQFFHRIGLDGFLTNKRRTGLASMIKRIRRIAE